MRSQVVHIRSVIRLWTQSISANSNYNNGGQGNLVSALTDPRYPSGLPKRDLHSSTVALITRLLISGSQGRTILTRLSSLPEMLPCQPPGPTPEPDEGQW